MFFRIVFFLCAVCFIQAFAESECENLCADCKKQEDAICEKIITLCNCALEEETQKEEVIAEEPIQKETPQEVTIQEPKSEPIQTSSQPIIDLGNFNNEIHDAEVSRSSNGNIELDKKRVMYSAACAGLFAALGIFLLLML